MRSLHEVHGDGTERADRRERQRREGRGNDEGSVGQEGVGKGSRVSLTDLHKGTHNCAAAIRESGAGISPSTPPLPSRRLPLRPCLSSSPLVVHPVVHPQPPPPPRPVEGGDGARALSQCAAIIFPHEWAAVSVVPGLVLRCSCCIFYPSPSRTPP